MLSSKMLVTCFCCGTRCTTIPVSIPGTVLCTGRMDPTSATPSHTSTSRRPACRSWFFCVLLYTSIVAQFGSLSTNVIKDVIIYDYYYYYYYSLYSYSQDFVRVLRVFQALNDAAVS